MQNLSDRNCYFVRFEIWLNIEDHLYSSTDYRLEFKLAFTVFGYLCDVIDNGPMQHRIEVVRNLERC